MSRALVITVIVGMGALGACSSGSSADPDVTAPPPGTVHPGDETTTTSTPVAATDPTTQPTDATEPSPAPTASTVGGDRYLPEGLGTVVHSAPGVESPGEITELIPNVWFFVPSEVVEGDSNIIPPLPEDRDILIAYAEMHAAYHEQASMVPVPAAPGERLAAALVDGGVRLAANVLGPASAAGQHLDLTDGIVLRPVVIADPRSDTEAFIFDCQLDGTVFVNADGTLADGQTRGVERFPQVASVVQQDGRWVVDRVTRDERACS